MGALSNLSADTGYLMQPNIAKSRNRTFVLLVAERDNAAIGVIYGFLWGEVFAYFQSGWEPEWAAANLGTVLNNEAIAAARAAGARVYDFLRGAEAYKYRFGATDRVDETWLVPRGSSGRLLDLRYRLKTRREAPTSNGQDSATEG